MSESDEPPVYLDHNATTPVLPEVAEAVSRALRDAWGNPSSGHTLGRAARRAIDLARAQVAETIGCEPDEIVFTSGGTESSNLAIRGAIEACDPKRTRIVTSVIEHPATLAPCRWLSEHGRSIVRLPVDHDGHIDVATLEDALGDAPALATVMHSNNETGVLQPIEPITRRACERGALVHVDAAQSVGKVPVNVRNLGADLMSIAGHKLYAPKGIGALYVRRGTRLAPLTLGAGHERGIRPGTENVPGIVGLGVACSITSRDLANEGARVGRLRDQLWERLSARVAGLVLHGARATRLPNTLSVRFPRAAGTAILAGASDVAASTGSACHEGGSEHASAIIVAMGVAEQEALGTVRQSLGRATTEADVDRAAASLHRSWERLVA